MTPDLAEPLVDGTGAYQVTFEADADEHIGVDAEGSGERAELVARQVPGAPLDGLQVASAHARGLRDLALLASGELADGTDAGPQVLGFRLVLALRHDSLSAGRGPA
jgi:hypothetical protein